MTTKKIKNRAEAAKHAPISLPAGSYSIEDLEKIASDAVKAKPDERDDKVAAALETANQTFTDRPEQGLAPDHKFVEVEREDLGVTERIQVFDAEAAEKAEEAAEKAGEKPTGTTSSASAGTTTASAADKE